MSSVDYEYNNANWQDLLTAYDGKKIAYEGQTYTASTNTVTGTPASGNPINWHNAVADFTDLTWTQGRRLSSLKAGNTNITYTYDTDGIRTRKKVGSVVHDYLTQNGKVVQEIYNSKVLQFFYDPNGNPYVFRYSTNGGSSWRTYYYLLNQQGDVEALVDSYGAICATYTYDAWGNPLTATTTSSSEVSTLADINPIRYRGYYYDTQTGLYYLQSRYYDPEVGRFINADRLVSIDDTFLGYNIFSYCNNSPVIGYDPAGEWNWAGVGMALGLVAVGALIVATGGSALVVMAGVAIGTTGTSLGYAAATNGTFTADVSVTNNHHKRGISLVVDFSSDDFYAELYPHDGVTSSEAGISYSNGIVVGYSGPNSYSEHFGGGGFSHCSGYGAEIYSSPDGKVQSYTASFSLSPLAESSLSGSYDYYYGGIHIGGNKKYSSSRGYSNSQGYYDSRGYPCSHPCG